MNIMKIHGFIAVTVLCVATLGVGAVAHAADFGGFDDGWYEPDYSVDPYYTYSYEPDYSYDPAFDYSYEPDYSYNPAFDYSYEPDYSIDPYYTYSYEPDYSYDPFYSYSYEPDYSVDPYYTYSYEPYEDYFVETGYEDYVYEDYTEYFVEDTYYEPYVTNYGGSRGGGGSFSFNINKSNNDNRNTNVNNNTNTNVITIANEQPTVSHQFQTPTCNIFASPSTVDSGDGTMLSWSSSSATNATLSGFGSVTTSGSRTVANLTADRVYTLTVSGRGGSSTCSTTIFVKQQQAPTCSLTVNPDSINSGDSALIHWSSSNATSATINQGVGSVSTNGSRTVHPSSSRTYTMTVSNSSGQSSTCSDHVTVDRVHTSAPTCQISVGPNSINKNQSAVLTWSTSNATSAFISNVGSVSTGGSRTVSPNSDTTYTLTVSGSGGSRTCSTHLDVTTSNNLFCSISAHPSSIQDGAGSVLTWHSTGATSAWISDGVGSVATNGSLTVRPNSTRNYTLTISDGHSGIQTCSTNVGVFTSHVSLTQVPYTGLDFGPVGNTIYWVTLIALAVGAGYVFVHYRGQVAEMALGFVGVRQSNSANEAYVADKQPASTPVEVPRAHEDYAPEGDVMTLEDDDNEGTMPSITIRRN